MSETVDRASERIADGAPIDWHAFESSAQSDDEREWFKCLHIVAEIPIAQPWRWRRKRRTAPP